VWKIRRTLRQKPAQSTQLTSCYTVVAVRMLTGENWTITRSDKRIMELAETRFLRPVAGCTLPDQKRNTDKRLELKISNLTERIERQK
jgi:hypothetical protein